MQPGCLAQQIALDALDLFSKIEVEGATLRCVWKKKAGADEGSERAIAALVAAGVAVRSAAPEQSTLEDVFAELTA